MDASTESPPIRPELERKRALAQRLDCLLDEDLGELTGTAPATRETWRKRGKGGPPHVMLGNTVLYPIEGVRRFLQERLEGREGVDPRRTL